MHQQTILLIGPDSQHVKRVNSGRENQRNFTTVLGIHRNSHYIPYDILYAGEYSRPGIVPNEFIFYMPLSPTEHNQYDSVIIMMCAPLER